MNMKKHIAIISILIAAAALSGCNTTGQGSKTYTRGQAQAAMSVEYGIVESVADVTIETKESGAGAVIGGVVGAVVGSTIGGGDGTKLATAAGALGGAAAGSAAEKMRGKKSGVEIQVKLDSGKTIVVVQAKDEEYVVGERVRILQTNDGTIRVRK
jgi:outer membrane lipoprotein SlyB